MIRRILLFLGISLAPVMAHGENHLLRHPTYANGKIAFSYLGDVWVANEDGSGVQRLTDHKAREVYPRFSPDGRWIAFSSNREGNYDVYVVSANGGKPRQLTFNSAEDYVVGWSQDGKRVLFQSSRDQGVFPGVATLFEIQADGGMEKALPTDWGSWASYSADGSKMAFTRHPGVWSRKHYRGSYSVDLWLMDVTDRRFTQLTDGEYKGNCLWPMYAPDGTIYFVADRLVNEKNVQFGGPEVMKSVNNLWKISEQGGAMTQVTHHTDSNLGFPSLSSDGKCIVYEDNFGLWKLDLASGKSIEIHIDIHSDSKESEVELRTIQSEAESFSLSPSGKRAAISTHGEIFSVATDRGEVQRVTESAWRDENPKWSPNGKWIAFVSDQSGREEVWMADERGHGMKKLTDEEGDKSGLVWSPDSKYLLWSSGHNLNRVEVDYGKNQVVASSRTGGIGLPQYSPDGKWISYSKQDTLLRSHVYLKELETSTEHLIKADDFLVSSGAKWTPDGKKLLLLGGIGLPAMSSLNRTVSQLYSISLTHIEKDPDNKDVDTEEQAQGSADTARRTGRGNASDPAGSNRNSEGGDAASDTQRRGGARGANGSADTTSPAHVEVKVEFEGMERRIRQLTRMGGSVSSVVPAPDSHTYALVASGGGEDGSGRPAIYTISEDGTGLNQVSQAPASDPADTAPRGRGGMGGGGFGELQWTKDSRTLYYLQGGGIYSVSISGTPAADSRNVTPTIASAGGGRRGGRGGGSTPAPAETSSNAGSGARRISFTVHLEVDQAAERQQVFTEAWRVMRNRFYDPRMHGVDWSAARATYEPLLSDIADSDELHTVLMQMIGELNASHTGVTGGGNASGDRVQTKFPGFDLEPDESGFYRVSRIHHKGPADHDYVNLHVGNFILLVNGKELKTTDNYWRRFNLAPGRKFEFSVNSKPSVEGAWTVSLEPISATAQSALDYDEWVEDRRQMVSKLSNGEIGYLHIKAMDEPSLVKFQRDLLANLDKKALIIDERFNGGGGIDQELLEILNQRKKYESYRGRDSVEIPRPIRAFFGPMAVLQNERSASNAEMFPEGFRTLGLGKVIGMPTYGAVIGTGSYRLLDGSTIRTPGIGVSTGSGKNFENYGVPPDVTVDNSPADFLTGHDRQIEKAIEVLRGELK